MREDVPKMERIKGFMSPPKKKNARKSVDFWQYFNVK